MLRLVENKRVKASSDIELKDRLVGVQRVVKVTKGGRAFGLSAIVVVLSTEGFLKPKNLLIEKKDIN